MCSLDPRGCEHKSRQKRDTMTPVAHSHFCRDCAVSDVKDQLLVATCSGMSYCFEVKSVKTGASK